MSKRDPCGPVTEEQHEQLTAMGFRPARDGDYVLIDTNRDLWWVWAPDDSSWPPHPERYLAQAQTVFLTGEIKARDQVLFDDPVTAAVYLLTLGCGTP